jgi:hypothetical protein
VILSIAAAILAIFSSSTGYTAEPASRAVSAAQISCKRGRGSVQAFIVRAANRLELIEIKWIFAE